MIRYVSKTNPNDVRAIGLVIGGDLREADLDENTELAYTPPAPFQILYTDASKEIKAIGSFKSFTPAPGDVIESFNGTIPARLDYFKRTAKDQLTEKTQAEKDAADAVKG